MKKSLEILGLILVSLFFGIVLGNLLHFSNVTQELKLPEDVINISKDVKIEVVEPYNAQNRTLYLDLSQWYCKATIIQGGSNPYPWDLASPNSPIAFFFLEDVADPTKADNYGDLIIRMNPIVQNETRKMVIVFYAEGAYDKFVYYKGELLHHYNDIDAESNYGIREILVP